jgi:hypothetical protein
MAVIVADFKEPVRGPGGVAFRAKACGLARASGHWQGWIEFNPLNGAPTFRSPYETVQPTNQSLRQWAGELTPQSLEGALSRALDRLCPGARRVELQGNGTSGSPDAS